MTSPRASAFIALSHQLIDLTGPFSGLEISPFWRHIDVLLRHQPRAEVLDAVDEFLITRVDLNGSGSALYVLKLFSMFDKILDELHHELNCAAGPSPQPFYTHGTPTFMECVHLHMGNIREFHRKIRKTFILSNLKNDANSDTFNFEIYSGRGYENRLRIEIKFPETSLPWSLNAMAGYCGLGGFDIYANDPASRPDLTRKALVYTATVFKAFRPVIDLPGAPRRDDLQE